MKINLVWIINITAATLLVGGMVLVHYIPACGGVVMALAGFLAGFSLSIKND